MEIIDKNVTRRPIQKTYWIQKVTGDNAGKDSKTEISAHVFITKIINTQKWNEEGIVEMRPYYKDWKLVDDIPVQPETIPEWIDLGIEKGLIVRKGVYWFFEKENLGKKKEELEISAQSLVNLQSKING